MYARPTPIPTSSWTHRLKAQAGQLSAEDASASLQELQQQGVDLAARSLQLLSLTEADKKEAHIKQSAGVSGSSGSGNSSSSSSTAITCMDVLRVVHEDVSGHMLQT